MIIVMNERKIPLLAARLASSVLPSPRLRERSALTPTPIPLTDAIIKFWIGKAIETLVSAASLTFATKTESTML